MSIELKFTGHVAEITLANPEKRNVLDLQTSRELKSAVDEAVNREETKAVLLLAAGRAFCAGGSLDELIAAQQDTTLLGQIYAGFLAVADCPLPTVAAVQGAAVGAGMNLALACDVRLVSPKASFDTRFLQLGIHCGGGHSWLLQRVLNWEQSVNALLLGQVLRGEEAVAAGLALACVDEDLLKQRALTQLDNLAAVPRELIEQSKRTLAQAVSTAQHSAVVDIEYEVQALSLQQPHAVETLQALKARIAGK
ncbi:MAG: enoyl-CoA hydratase-related protein [Halieaceae bacterium]